MRKTSLRPPSPPRGFDISSFSAQRQLSCRPIRKAALFTPDASATVEPQPPAARAKRRCALPRSIVRRLPPSPRTGPLQLGRRQDTRAPASAHRQVKAGRDQSRSSPSPKCSNLCSLLLRTFFSRSRIATLTSGYGLRIFTAHSLLVCWIHRDGAPLALEHWHPV